MFIVGLLFLLKLMISFTRTSKFMNEVKAAERFRKNFVVQDVFFYSVVSPSKSEVVLKVAPKSVTVKKVPNASVV